MEFLDNYSNIKGWLQIIKTQDGNSEVVFDDHNIICSGIGEDLALLFSSSGTNVSAFQIGLIQLGVCGSVGLEVSSTGLLGSSVEDYGGDSFLVTGTGTVVSAGTPTTGELFIEVPLAYIDKVGTRSVRWNIPIDENTGNGLTLNEIGLFANNPRETSPLQTYLCAYRYFGDIPKTNKFSLLFRWTIEF